MLTESRELWLAERRKGIGGSDAAGCAGLSRWTTPLEVYESKTSDTDRDETPEMRRGTLLEPVVRQMYSDQTGHTVAQPTGILSSESHPFMLANLDGVVQDAPRLLECKTARDKSDWGEPGSAEIPIEYLCQCQHYLHVARYDVIDVAVLFGNGFEFAVYEVPADKEFQELLIAAESRLWEAVQARIPPEPINTEDVRRRWPRARFQATVTATETDSRVAEALAVIRAQAKALEALQEQCEAHLKMSIGDNEAIHDAAGRIIATWKNRAGSRRFDDKRLEKEHPEIHRQYVTVGQSSRTFLFKPKVESCLTTNPTITIPTLPPGLLSPPLETAEDS